MILEEMQRCLEEIKIIMSKITSLMAKEIIKILLSKLIGQNANSSNYFKLKAMEKMDDVKKIKEEKLNFEKIVYNKGNESNDLDKNIIINDNTDEKNL